MGLHQRVLRTGCLIYLLPVLTHKIGGGVFIISGFIALAIMLFYLHIFVKFTGEEFYKSSKTVGASLLGIYFIINILYFANLMPPIPISLKNSGVYHLIYKNQDGQYLALSEKTDWKSYFDFSQDFHVEENSEVYVYSAVFSPSSLNLTVIHKWQYFDPATGEWIDYDRVELPVIGGRDGGFRTYSVKDKLYSGNWRVNVETLGGQVIGRLRFEVIPTAFLSELQTIALD